jgi:hypothetical protein
MNLIPIDVSIDRLLTDEFKKHKNYDDIEITEESLVDILFENRKLVIFKDKIPRFIRFRYNLILIDYELFRITNFFPKLNNFIPSIAGYEKQPTDNVLMLNCCELPCLNPMKQYENIKDLILNKVFYTMDALFTEDTYKELDSPLFEGSRGKLIRSNVDVFKTELIDKVFHPVTLNNISDIDRLYKVPIITDTFSELILLNKINRINSFYEEI